MHATATGLALTSLDLRSDGSLAEALDAIERAARSGPRTAAARRRLERDDLARGRPPTAAELDRASYGGLVYLARVDIHSAVVSSSLLAAVPQLAGHAPGYAATAGSTSRPTTSCARRRSGLMTRGQRDTAQRAALQAAAALGIACVHEMAGPVISDPGRPARAAGPGSRPNRCPR